MKPKKSSSDLSFHSPEWFNWRPARALLLMRKSARGGFLITIPIMGEKLNAETK
jgi:hypothetical protein